MHSRVLHKGQILVSETMNVYYLSADWLLNSTDINMPKKRGGANSS